MRGIYFLADDSMFEFVVAFLNSLRTFEPNLPLYFIPYSEDSVLIESLADKYGFVAWQDTDALARCDNLSSRFHALRSGQYRKLVIWQGPFQEFIYIDVDTIILHNFNPVFDLLSDFDVLTGTSNLESIRKYVWKEGVESIEVGLDIAYAANTGLIASKKGVLCLEGAEAKLDDASNLKAYMALECMEQPFLNYLIVKSGKTYSSLSHIRKTQLRSDLPKEVWSGLFQEDVLKYERPPLFVHWAGVWRNGDHLKSATWNHFRYLRDGC